MESFSRKVKQEITTFLPKTKNCCLYSFLYGMTFPCESKEGVYKIKTTFVENACDLHVKMVSLLVKKDTQYSFNEREVLISSNVIRYSTIAEIVDKIFKCPHCREHFFKGLFFSCGTMNSPEKSYRLELVFSNESHANETRSYLAEIGLNFNVNTRNNKSVLYIKRSEIIEDFLALMGACNSAFEMMNCKINNEVRNIANRATNCDSANINKSLNASKKYIDAINLIIRKNCFDDLSKPLQEIAKARIEFPDANITELGKKLSPQISKSGVYHRLENILKIAEEIKKK